MPEIHGFFLNKKDKRGGIRIKKTSENEYIVNVITDLSESGKYKARNEGCLKKTGDFFSAELVTAEGLTTVMELREQAEGLQVSFIYKGGTDSAEGMEAVDVVEYERAPELEVV
jgi:hypothetical protein